MRLDDKKLYDLAFYELVSHLIIYQILGELKQVCNFQGFVQSFLYIGVTRPSLRCQRHSLPPGIEPAIFGL